MAITFSNNTFTIDSAETIDTVWASALDLLPDAASAAGQAARIGMADEQITPTHYRKRDKDTGEIILEKQVTDDGSGNITLDDSGAYEP